MCWIIQIPANIYLSQLNNARTRCEMYSALIIKTPEILFNERFYLYDTGF